MGQCFNFKPLKTRTLTQYELRFNLIFANPFQANVLFLHFKNFYKTFWTKPFGHFQWVKKWNVSLVLVKVKIFWPEILLTFGQRNEVVS